MVDLLVELFKEEEKEDEHSGGCVDIEDGSLGFGSGVVGVQQKGRKEVVPRQPDKKAGCKVEQGAEECCLVVLASLGI